MAGNLQPLDQKFPVVNADGTPTDYFTRWAQERQIDIGNGITEQDLIDYLLAHELQEGNGIGLTPSGNLSDSPTITAKVQEILDQISTTQGTVLYRGAAGWAALAPGTSGNFLKTNGAGADPAWAALPTGNTEPTIVQSGILCNAASLGQITLGAAPTAGNLLVALGSRWAGTIVTNSAGGWTRPFDSTGSNDIACLFCRLAGASEPALQQWSSTSTGWSFALYEIHGASPASILNMFGNGTIASSSSVAANLGVPKSTCLGVGMFNAEGRTAPTLTVSNATVDSSGTDATVSNGGPRTMKSCHQTGINAGAWQPSCAYSSSGINGYMAALIGST